VYRAIWADTFQKSSSAATWKATRRLSQLAALSAEARKASPSRLTKRELPRGRAIPHYGKFNSIQRPRAFEHLLFVEQPFHRDVALGEETAAHLQAWSERPPIIIDESDAEPGSLVAALAAGYVGTSHKNCKGVFRGIANACLIAHRRRENASLRMSAEDLINLGPIALLQDLAVVAALGIPHVERNGHHYFRGLQGFPAEVQQQVVDSHPDLYATHPAGFPTLRIAKGRIETGSVIAAPFGAAFDLNLNAFTPA
jgi:hypothetical protein